MDTSLSPELQALCEWASHESDPKKLLELTRRINELLQQAEQKKAPQAHRQPGASPLRRVAAIICSLEAQILQANPQLVKYRHFH